MYLDINQCKLVVDHFPNDVESIFVFRIFLCRQLNSFFCYIKNFFVSDPFLLQKKMTSASNAEVISFTKQFRQCRGRTSFPAYIISL